MKKLVIAGRKLPQHPTLITNVDTGHPWPGAAGVPTRPWWANDSDIIKARKERQAMEDLDTRQD